MSETLKPWYAVGTPHEDIHKGRLEEAVFATNIWPVVQGTTEEIDLTGIDWVIVGGESGPKARPMSLSWVKGIHDQCLAAEVPFFFKQWGGLNKKKAGRVLDCRTWDEMPVLAGIEGVVLTRSKSQIKV